ncbi:hypothetical protein, partial [Pseudomonas sp. FW305-122]|uniref:hypothetical protein n=1 Tax=Pseudomonas sp. FW305-122 TaxID=2070561 RepID=UPI001C44A0E2
YRVVVNEAFENGRWEEKSLEAIGRNEKGEYVPLFYVKEGNAWVPSRTFRGHSTLTACIKCHSHPNIPNVFTAFPYRARPGLAIDQLAKPYQG